MPDEDFRTHSTAELRLEGPLTLQNQRGRLTRTAVTHAPSANKDVDKSLTWGENRSNTDLFPIKKPEEWK